MEAPQLDALIEIDAEGRLHGAPELLARLTNQTFRLSVEGQTITLRPPMRRLSEIADAGERARVRALVLEELAIADVPPLPDDYDLRADIYD